MSPFSKLKGLFVIMVLFIACLVLVGCGGDKKEADSQPTAGQTQEESITELLKKGQQIEGMSFDYTLTGEGLTMSGKMWVQGEKVKIETTTEGQKVVMISDGEAVYNYTPEQNMAIKFSLEENEQNLDTPQDYTEAIDTSTVKELETVDYEGVKCKVFLVKEKNNKEELKMWVREDYGIPIRVEVIAEDGSKAVMEYKNLEVGTLSEDTFKLPDGVQIQDMNNVMNRIPEESLIP